MSQTVLVADDSQTIRKVVQMALKASDFEVVGVGSAREAVEAAQQKPTVILLDYFMPDGSGYDVCRALQQNEATRSIPVVMLGGTYKEFDAGKAHASGAVEVVMKPFTTDELVGAIETAVEKGASAAAQPAPAQPAPAQPEATPFQQPAAQQPSPQQPSPGQFQQPAAQPQPTQRPASGPAPSQAPVPESQPRIPVNAGAQSRAGSQPHIPSGGSNPGTTMPASNSGVHQQRKPTPVPSATASSTPTPTPTPESGSGARPMPMGRDEMEAMIGELVKDTVRAELPGLLRNVMGEIFQKKVLPKLVQHSEQKIQQTLAQNLDQQVTLKVRQELERLLED